MITVPRPWLSADWANCRRWSAWTSNMGRSAPPGDSMKGTHANSTASCDPVAGAPGKTQPMLRRSGCSVDVHSGSTGSPSRWVRNDKIVSGSTPQRDDLDEQWHDAPFAWCVVSAPGGALAEVLGQRVMSSQGGRPCTDLDGRL